MVKHITEERMLELQDELLAAISLEVGPLKEEIETIASYLDMAADRHNSVAEATLSIGETSAINFDRMTRFILAISNHVGFDVKKWFAEDRRKEDRRHP